MTTRTPLKQAGIHQVNAADYASAARFWRDAGSPDYVEWFWSAHKAANATLLARNLLGITDSDQLFA